MCTLYTTKCKFIACLLVRAVCDDSTSAPKVQPKYLSMGVGVCRRSVCVREKNDSKCKACICNSNYANKNV